MRMSVGTSWLLLGASGAAAAGGAFLMLVGRDGLTLIDAVFVLCVVAGALPVAWSLLCPMLLPFVGGYESQIPCLKALPYPSPKVGVLVPVYAEEIEAVAERLSATWRSLRRIEPRLADAVVFCILSDSPRSAERRERDALQRVVRSENLPTYYRRRSANISAKCGNVHDFLDSEEALALDLIVGFDADTVMSGSAISRLVRILCHPRNGDVALVQSPTYVHRPKSLIGLVDGWSRRHIGLAGTIVASRMMGGANYFGHNYVARPQALRAASRIVLANPVRSRFAGLCGYVASHDYAEGTVLSELGYRVLVDDQPNESYEETPATFPEYIARETRWLRGSFQHLAGGWVRRGKPAQRLALLLAVHQHLNCVVGTIGLGCGLYLLHTQNAFLGATSFQWCAETQSLVWSYTGLPLMLLAILVAHMLLPGLLSLWWNERRHGVAGSFTGCLGCFLARLPEYTVVFLYGLFVGPVVSGALCLAALRTPFRKVTWQTNRNQTAGYPLHSALLDLMPLWSCGGLILLVALHQPTDIRPFLLIVGLPLMLSPLTAVVISSSGVYSLFSRFGLFASIDIDVVAAIQEIPQPATRSVTGEPRHQPALASVSLLRGPHLPIEGGSVNQPQQG